MTNLISFPFRLGPAGSVVTREDNSDEYYAEELAQLITTEPGERALVPDYGVTDFAFDPESRNVELVAKVSLFGPPVEVAKVFVNYVQEGVADVTVEFD